MGREEKKMANSPLQPPTLATFRSWGSQRELVICRHKSTAFDRIAKLLLRLIFINLCDQYLTYENL